MLRFYSYSVENNTNIRPDLDKCVRKPFCAIHIGAPKSMLKYAPDTWLYADDISVL